MAHPVNVVAASLRRQSIRNSSIGNSAAKLQDARHCCKQRRLITNPHMLRYIILNFISPLSSALITMELSALLRTKAT